MGIQKPTFNNNYSSGAKLTEELIAIGFNLNGSQANLANIEETLVAASIEGIQKKDYRVLSLLIQWIQTHNAFILVDRLAKLIFHLNHRKVRYFWFAVGQALGKSDNRYNKLKKKFDPPKRAINILSNDTGFQISKYGRYEFFQNTCILLPKNFVRNRPQDILTVYQLSIKHKGFKNRVVMGPSYRADLWTILELEKGQLTATELAKRAFCSYRSAWLAKEHFKMLNAA